jgi:flagellar export protein FliJ
MKPFQFRLSHVLSVREMETLRAQEALASAQMAATEAAVHLQAARSARQAFSRELEVRRGAGMAAWEWAATGRQHEELSRAETAASETLQRALEMVAARQGDLEGALRREESLQHLKEQQWEEYRQADLQAEQADNDEMARTMRLSRKGVGVI